MTGPGRWRAAAVPLLAAVLLGIAPAAAPAAPAGAEGVAGDGSGLVVALDRTSVLAEPGERVTFESTVRNTGDRPLSGLIAQLDVLTSDGDVYVDPEDWSARRTQYLDRLEPGRSVRLTWEVRAVTTGPIVLFVAVTDPTSQRVTASRPLEMTVGGQRVVNAGGVLPLVLAMPAGILALLGATLLRRRRHR